MMSRSKILLFLLLFFIGAPHLNAQHSVIDSLLNLLKTDKEDSLKVNHLNNLAWEIKARDPDTAIIISNQALKLARALPNGQGKVGAMNALGRLGVCYRLKSNFPKALDYFLQALAASEDLHNNYAIAVQLGNIGNVFTQQGEYEKALNYYFRALNMKEKQKNKKEISVTLGNIGNVYYAQKDYAKALEYNFRGLKVAEEVGTKSGIAIKLGNIGIVYKDMGDLNKALEYYSKALKIAREIGSKNSIAADLGNIGAVYHAQKKYPQAEKILLEALDLVKSTGELSDQQQFEYDLSMIYNETGRFKEALAHYKTSIVIKDTIFNTEKNKEITRKEMNYVFEKKQVADSIRNVEHMKQEALKNEQEIKQQRLYTYGGAIGFILMMAVAIISFRAYRDKQRTNEIISHQKNIVEDKQKEVLDSIHYAKRIQNSLLPSEKYIHKCLKSLNKN